MEDTVNEDIARLVENLAANPVIHRYSTSDDGALGARNLSGVK